MLEVGSQAALMLLERMKNPRLPAEKRILPVELIVRETS